MLRVLSRLRRQPARRLLYNYQHFQQLQARPSRAARFFQALFVAVSLTAFAYYMWWPKHTFPRPVARELRKGLWAESDKGENDYQLALKHYLQALEEGRAAGLDPVSDEYTGVQLKVAEMYERMLMPDDAAFVYNEIATLYLAVLRRPPLVQGMARRAHLIQRDLRVALKLVELNRANPLLAKAILVTHLLLAQEEVDRRLGVEKTRLLDPVQLAELTQQGKPESLSAGADGLALEPIVLETNPEAWEPFRDEFFNCMDLLLAICVSVGDIQAASGIRVAMTTKMLLAEAPPDQLLLSQCNTASLLYFQAEQLQAEEQRLRREFALAAGVDAALLQQLHEPSHVPRPGDEAAAAEIQAKVAAHVTAADRQRYQDVVASRQRLIDMVQATYLLVVLGAKRLPPDARDSPTVAESVALATYGLGVVNLHLAQYDAAERLLREARVRSKACGYDALIDEIERELGKLFDERKSVRKPDTGVELDIHLTK